MRRKYRIRAPPGNRHRGAFGLVLHPLNCGRIEEVFMPQSPGSMLAHYQLVAPLGEGGMGEVWKARDTHLDRDVAVKVLAKGALDDATARERFRHEAHVLSRLSHPGVATIFDFATQDGIDFLVMEYVPGGTLEARLHEGPLPLDDVYRLGAEIGDALTDAHAKG